MKTPVAKVLTLEEFAQHLRTEWPRIWKSPLKEGKPFQRLDFGRRPALPLQPGERVWRRSRIAELLGLSRAVFSRLERHPGAPALLADGAYDVDRWQAFARKRK